MMTQSARTIAQQQELIHKMAWNEAMGCHTRAGFEHVVWPEIACRARYFVYFDVDGVKQINDLHETYDAFDALIKTVLSRVRSTDIVSGQWKSGDEFLVCMLESPERDHLDPEGMVKRLTAEMAKVGLTAIFVVVEVRSANLKENMQPAEAQILAAKKARGSTSR